MTKALVSYITKRPTTGKQSAIEYLFQNINVAIYCGDEVKELDIIQSEDTNNYLKLILKDYCDALQKSYGEDNPLIKYDVFLVGIFAAIGYSNEKNTLK